MNAKNSRIVGRIITYLTVAFMTVPVVVLIGSSFTTTRYVAFPPQGFTFEWFGKILTDSELLGGIGISAGLAVIATVISIALAVAFTLVQERYPGRLTGAISAYSLGPAMVPHVVLGVALLFLLAQLNLVGAPAALLIAHVVICIPFAVRSVAAAAQAIDLRTQRAAAILGAPPMLVFWRITLPALKPGIVGACVMSFLVSFNNVAVTIFIAGSDTRTFPVVLFLRSVDVVSPIIPAVSTVVLIATAVVVSLAQRWFNIFSGIGGARVTTK